jgi:hypothetical protein
VAGPRGWKRLASSNTSGWSTNVTAIDLAPPNSPRAILFVVKSSARFAVPAIPTTTARLTLSRGFSATAWQRQGSNLLYVLVVEAGHNQQLESYVRVGPKA